MTATGTIISLSITDTGYCFEFAISVDDGTVGGGGTYHATHACDPTTMSKADKVAAAESAALAAIQTEDPSVTRVDLL